MSALNATRLRRFWLGGKAKNVNAGSGVLRGTAVQFTPLASRSLGICEKLHFEKAKTSPMETRYGCQNIPVRWKIEKLEGKSILGAGTQLFLNSATKIKRNKSRSGEGVSHTHVGCPVG